MARTRGPFLLTERESWRSSGERKLQVRCSGRGRESPDPCDFSHRPPALPITAQAGRAAILDFQGSSRPILDRQAGR